MPYDGYTGCSSGAYARKHNPWVNFTNVPASSNLTLNAFPPTTANCRRSRSWFRTWTTTCTTAPSPQGDTWLRQHIDGYVPVGQDPQQPAGAHLRRGRQQLRQPDSDGRSSAPRSRPGIYSERIDHYDVLRTLEDAYDLPHAGASASATPITDVWGTSAPDPARPPAGTRVLSRRSWWSTPASRAAPPPRGPAAPTWCHARLPTSRPAGGSWLAWLGSATAHRHRSARRSAFRPAATRPPSASSCTSTRPSEAK